MGYLDLKKIDNVIFDFDGLLVNSEDVIGECWIKTCEYYGIHYPEGFFDDIVGVSKNVTYNLLIDYMDVVIGEKEFFERRALFIEEEVNKGNIHLLPGVQEILDLLKTIEIPMYIATSSSRFWPINITERLGILTYFKGIYGYEDVEKVKPSPELYLKVVSEHQLNKSTTVIFEDSLSGIQAATSAGIDTIVVNAKKYMFSSEINQKILFQIKGFDELKTDLE